jgi:hypothetical protein
MPPGRPWRRTRTRTRLAPAQRRGQPPQLQVKRERIDRRTEPDKLMTGQSPAVTSLGATTCASRTRTIAWPTRRVLPYSETGTRNDQGAHCGEGNSRPSSPRGRRSTALTERRIQRAWQAAYHLRRCAAPRRATSIRPKASMRLPARRAFTCPSVRPRTSPPRAIRGASGRLPTGPAPRTVDRPPPVRSY